MDEDAEMTKRKLRRNKRSPHRPGKYWAVGLSHHHMPCLFNSREDAEANAEPDERVYRVVVQIVREVQKRPAEFEGNPFGAQGTRDDH